MLSSVSGRLSGSRGGAVALGIGAAILAGILLLVYLNRYRDSVRAETAGTPVLVAKRLILKGTSGTQIAQKDQYQAAELERGDVKAGAIADPAYLSGRVAVNDILPGQQLTTTDFTTTTTDAVDTRISGPQRGISVSIDNVHGSLSQLQVGDHVDIYVGVGASGGGQSQVKLFRANVLVMALPTGDSGNLVLRVLTRDAADFAFAADNMQLWFVLRPAAGATPTRPDTATANSVLASGR
jgi:Flp pilus assembly protein CpaB